MIFNRRMSSIVFLCSFLFIAGCPGFDDNEINSGLTVHIAEVHVEEQAPTVTQVKQNTAPVNQAVIAALPAKTDKQAQGAIYPLAATGGYDHDNLEHHDIIDNASHLVSMYRAYLVLDQIKLLPCASISRLPQKLFNALIPSAFAHAGHGAEPVGGRSLDKPNVIDIVTRDEFYLPLGDLAAAPGSYCGVTVSLTRLAGAGYGKPAAQAESNDDPTTIPDIPELNGKMLALRADYCSTPDGSGGCAGRTKIQIDDSGLTLPPVQTILFTNPLTLGNTNDSGYVAIGIAYGEWLRDVDVSILAGDDGERQKVINNIAGSIHIYAKGLGDLPPNVE